MTARRVPDIGTIAPATRARPRVAPVVVVRHGGLPVGVLDDLAAPSTLHVLREAAQCRRGASRLAVPITDGLYRLVPGLPDSRTRRAVLDLRRDVHNGRWSAAVADRIRNVIPVLDAELAHRLGEWAELSRTAADRRMDAEQHYRTEVSAAAGAMRTHLLSPAVVGGLAVASAEFTQRLLAEPLEHRLNARSARSATAYLTRIAVKTSPFSSLTTVSVARFTDCPAPDRSDAAARVVTSSRPVAVALLLACIRNEDAVGMLDVTGVNGLRHVGGRPLANLTIRLVHNGLAARVDEITDCGLAAWAVDHLPPKKIRYDELLSGTAGWAAAVGPARVRRLLEAGLLQPVLPWAASSGDDFAELAKWASVVAPPVLHGFVDALNRLAAQQRIVTVERSASRRLGAVATARTAVRAAFTALGAPEPAWVREQPLFHEVESNPAVSVSLDAPVRDDLAEIARWLAPLTWRDPRYDELVRGFVRLHGRGTSGVGLLDFLYTFLTRGDFTAAAMRPPTVDRETARDPDRLRGHHTVGHAGHAVFFQLAARSPEQVAEGAHLTVVNAVHPGGLGLLGRWGGVPALHDPLAGPLAEWAHQLHPDCAVYQVQPYADWADLQRPTLASLPRLRLPGDLPDAGDAADLTDLTVAHDLGTDTLQVFDAGGCPVAFAYFGAVPQHLVNGFAQALCLLSQPWLTIGRVDRDPHFAMDIDAQPAFQPRFQRDRIVWARARWSFALADLPRPRREDATVDFLSEVEDWRHRHGLPAEVFATRVTHHGGRVGKEKPQWLGFDHPHAIWNALGAVSTEVSRVDFTEVLPGRGEQWTGGRDDKRLAAEFIGLVCHG